MADDAFEDIFNQGGYNEGYYTDTAMQYLSDFEEIKEKFENCYAKYLKHKKDINKLKEIVATYQREVQNLKVVLQKREKHIEGLLSRLECCEGNKFRLSTAELLNRVSSLSNTIRNYIEHYKKTGKFDKIDEVISSVRSLFNMALVELNILNSENQEIGGVLKILVSLEVNLKNILFIKIRILI